MIIIDSVMGVSTQLQSDTQRSARISDRNLSGGDSSGASFEHWLNFYTQKAENNAPDKRESNRENGIYMGYYLPMFLVQDANPSLRNRRSDS